MSAQNGERFTTTLVRRGNSAALTIDADILKAMGIDSDTLVTLTLQGQQLIIERADRLQRAEQLRVAAERSHARYAEAYKKLAE